MNCSSCQTDYPSQQLHHVDQRYYCPFCCLSHLAKPIPRSPVRQVALFTQDEADGLRIHQQSAGYLSLKKRKTPIIRNLLLLLGPLALFYGFIVETQLTWVDSSLYFAEQPAQGAPLGLSLLLLMMSLGIMLCARRHFGQRLKRLLLDEQLIFNQSQQEIRINTQLAARFEDIAQIKLSTDESGDHPHYELSLYLTNGHRLLLAKHLHAAPLSSIASAIAALIPNPSKSVSNTDANAHLKH